MFQTSHFWAGIFRLFRKSRRHRLHVAVSESDVALSPMASGQQIAVRNPASVIDDAELPRIELSSGLCEACSSATTADLLAGRLTS
jgi:hypothetical protein